MLVRYQWVTAELFHTFWFSDSLKGWQDDWSLSCIKPSQHRQTLVVLVDKWCLFGYNSIVAIKKRLDLYTSVVKYYCTNLSSGPVKAVFGA
jgi:hypothetical protein